ncbi:tetratricopeptide repeat protein [Streptomyces sp. 796.1]|uniref:tetratricopeptide repeat protein n=1 Tax=Streptomyces sp. 796.1 TaxID=3163029 RepID=UPI0039C8DD0D
MDQGPLDFGTELRRLRSAAGLSITALSGRIHYSKGYLSKVETGKAPGNLPLALACDDELATGGVLAALVRARPEGTGRRSIRATYGPVIGLPVSTPLFTGRAVEIDRLTTFITGSGSRNVCVLSGLAGAGKTALAVRAARETVSAFPDGCLFLDLGRPADGGAPADQGIWNGTSAHDVLDPLLRLLHVPMEQIPAALDARINLYRSRLRGKRLLLVLDNAGSAAQVAPLLPPEPRCRVIITSRHRLNAMDDAVHLPVRELSANDAVDLFRSVAGAPADTAKDEVVRRVVTRCDLLPLAIRIAAARFRSTGTWSLADFEARLADESSRLAVLDDGERSVAAAFSLSCRALTPAQLRVFGLLALHPGRDVELQSIAALTGLSLARTTSVIDRLGDAHLISTEAAGHIRVHDLLREFAREHVLANVAAVEQDAAVRRLLDHSLLLTESSDEFLAPHRYRMPLALGNLPEASQKFVDRASALNWIDAQWPNLVRLCHLAADRGLHRQCWQLAFLLREFFFLSKLWDPWIDTHLRAAASAEMTGNKKGLAMTLNNLGIAHVDRGDLHTAVRYCRDALALFDELHDEHGITNATSNLAWAELYLGDHAQALRDLRVVLRAYHRQGNERNAAITLRGIALAEAELDQHDEAVHHATQAYQDFTRLNLPVDLAMAMNCIAWAHFKAGNHLTARDHYEQAVLLGEQCGSSYETARAITGLGNVEAALGRDIEAAEHWAHADELYGDFAPGMVGEARARWTLC